MTVEPGGNRDVHGPSPQGSDGGRTLGRGSTGPDPGVLDIISTAFGVPPAFLGASRPDFSLGFFTDPGDVRKQDIGVRFADTWPRPVGDPRQHDRGVDPTVTASGLRLTAPDPDGLLGRLLRPEPIEPPKLTIETLRKAWDYLQKPPKWTDEALAIARRESAAVRDEFRRAVLGEWRHETALITNDQDPAITVNGFTVRQSPLVPPGYIVAIDPAALDRADDFVFKPLRDFGRYDPPAPEILPVEERDEPIMGWKAAKLCFDFSAGRRVRFLGIGMAVAYDRTGRAECSGYAAARSGEKPGHRTPGEKCGCGFYVLADRHSIRGLHNYRDVTAILRVEAWGQCIECAHDQPGSAGRYMPPDPQAPPFGWRTEFQRVLDVYVSPWCLRCHYAFTEGVPQRADKILVGTTGNYSGSVRPICADCAADPAIDPASLVALDDLAAMVGVPCQWDTDRSPDFDHTPGLGYHRRAAARYLGDQMRIIR